jgi:hypothetical protein
MFQENAGDIVSTIKKHPLPETTEECKMLLETVLEKADSSLISDQKAAFKALERLCEKKCTKALTYVMREFSNSSLLLKQQLANKARDCL